ncbi:hypothetical protein Kpol_1002p52 [Vanderwaltozyma polyspora DSM 70294]|uniref:NAD(+) diphosphatase n=1 Tax=Vanderwaltozyma polyspora (strain ATCC 22028 / DSM 70294 / BCRC 21397 / CBS 2163 / NBRC 10782 / NRRL Y-8283 / UCD 57-17) TaxID=436907 RepID=A7TE83_VANPO|nr:uncharacterized protein Kpol_1002p52 [Vanderwaltozyma polyspora DSM 70294]EDO19405.1 hypothetical protein Kpol_1002p52 [Vanderwaltozyma polyspora DSM 70294]
MFFGEAALNRVSFLRSNRDFIKIALSHESTTFIPFINGEGLLDAANHDLYMCSLKQDAEIGSIVEKVAEAIDTPMGRCEITGVNLTFLGLDESNVTNSASPMPSSSAAAASASSSGCGSNCVEFCKGKYRGAPYFAIDLRSASSNSKTVVQPSDYINLSKRFKPISLLEMITLNNKSASLYSQAKMYLDWSSKFKFCPGCGSPMYAIEAGTKMACSNKDKSIVCNVRDSRLNNVCFPRTDPSVIIAIANSDYSKTCLVRTKRHMKDRNNNPIKMYSTIAGFLEPSETVETACSREIWEESGIKCPQENIKIINTQPWPYPASMMIGCVGIVDFNGSNENIDLDNDKELLDAKWFNTKDLIHAIDSSHQCKGFFVDFIDDIKIPNDSTIAFQLMNHICNKYKAINSNSNSTALL